MKPYLLMALLLLLPRVALACPVCVGQTDAPLARATTLGVGVMLGVVGLVMAAGAGLFWRLRRRSLAAAEGTC
jgi:hypothetical protein